VRTVAATDRGNKDASRCQKREEGEQEKEENVEFLVDPAMAERLQGSGGLGTTRDPLPWLVPSLYVFCPKQKRLKKEFEGIN